MRSPSFTPTTLFFLGLSACVAGVEQLEPLEPSGDEPDAGVVDAEPIEPASAMDAGVPPDPLPVEDSLLVVAGELGFAVVDPNEPGFPILVEDPGYGKDEEPLPLYDLATDGNRIFAARFGGFIEVYEVVGGKVDFAGSFYLFGEAPSWVDVYDIEIRDGRLYAAQGAFGIAIFDVQEITEPRFLGEITARSQIFDVVLLDERHLVTYDDEDSALLVYDVSDPASSRLVAGYITDFVGSYSSGMAVLGDLVALNARYFEDGSGLWFFDLTTPEEPASLGFNPEVRAPKGRGVSLYREEGGGVFGYFADGQDGVAIAEASIGSEPPQGARLTTVGSVSQTLVYAGNLFVAELDQGLSVHKLDKPNEPELLTRISLPSNVSAVHLTLVEDQR